MQAAKLLLLTAVQRMSAVLILSIGVSSAHATPALKDFGQLPGMRSNSISPDGKHYASIRNQDSIDYLVIADAKTMQTVGGAKIPKKIKARDVYFASNNYVIFTASDTKNLIGYNVSQIEITGAFAYSLKTKKIQILLNKTKGLAEAQSGLGGIVGVDEQADLAFMPGYAGQSPYPKNLYRVNLKTGVGRRHSKGRSSTLDWFVGAGGKVLAREDYNEKAQEHRVYSYISGAPVLIYSEEIGVPRLSISAVSHDESKLLFIDRNDETAGAQYLSLEDGAITATSFQKPDTDIRRLLTDINRKLHAIVYSQHPFYEFQNYRIQKLYQRIGATFPKSALSYLGSTSDMSRMLFRVSGNYQPHAIMLFDSDKPELRMIGSGYSSISAEDLGEVESIRYDARDDLSIPAIITWPASKKSEAERKNLPLIVFPHGGPESYDAIGFDWWAQYFANQGYMILQPNFRGSSGYGREFMLAGRGKWGREMQDDVSDGVLHLVEQGAVDPDRVCIMGASYGGYSALAGGAFSPELYRCVIAVAGVSDLPKMLIDEKISHGSKHWAVNYWREVIGDSSKQREELKQVSPVNYAQQFAAPVLILHGKDDTVVPFSQSKVMHKALKKAGKNSKLVALKGEDHWLSYSKTRLEMLKEIDKFIKLHNPVTEEAQSAGL